MKRIVSVVIVLGVGLFGFLLMEPDVDNVSDAQLSNEHSLMQPIPVKPPFSKPAEISSIKNKNVETESPKKLSDFEAEKIEYDVKKLNSLVTKDNDFSMTIMLEMLEAKKFDETVFYLLDKSSYDDDLQENNSVNSALLHEIPKVNSGRLIVEQVACDRKFCFASFLTTDGNDWNDTKLDESEISSYFSLLVIDATNPSRLLYVYSIDKDLNSVIYNNE
jgi:hypothetical protein